MMKRLLLLLAGMALAGAASAQTQWSPPGATWTYTYSLFSAYGDLAVSYAGPTTVGSQAALRYTRVLSTKDRQNPASPIRTSALPDLVLRADVDRLYVLANDQQFYTLFNFAAQAGDTWLTPAVEPQTVCAGTLVRLRVDSAGTATVGGVARRWLRLRLQTQPGQLPVRDQAWGGRVYEGIGPTETYLLPQGMVSCGGTDPGFLGSLLCFRASSQATYFPGASQLCSVVTAAEQQAAQVGFEVYPNPSAGQLQLRLPAAAASATLELHDLTGRCLLRTAVPASGQLDVRHLPKGLYALSLRVPGLATPATRRIMLQ